MQHSERFRNWNFIPQTKFNGTSLHNKFGLCENRKSHFKSFRKHKRNYVTNDEIDINLAQMSVTVAPT